MAWVRRNGEAPSGISTGGTGGVDGPAAPAGVAAARPARAIAASARGATQCFVNVATRLTIELLRGGARLSRCRVLDRDVNVPSCERSRTAEERRHAPASRRPAAGSACEIGGHGA